ncbi:MAG: type II toxin-antitoxin system RelE/ParE family toxin [Thermoplasmata archaeon]
MKTYDILLNPKVEKELKNLPKETSNRLKESLKKLKNADIKKLAGTSDPVLYRLRVGEHRAIYWVDEEKEEILVEKIAPRKKSYRDIQGIKC